VALFSLVALRFKVGVACFTCVISPPIHLTAPPTTPSPHPIDTSELTRWLAQKAEAMGVEIYPGFAGEWRGRVDQGVGWAGVRGSWWGGLSRIFPAAGGQALIVVCCDCRSQLKPARPPHPRALKQTPHSQPLANANIITLYQPRQGRAIRLAGVRGGGGHGGLWGSKARQPQARLRPRRGPGGQGHAVRGGGAGFAVRGGWWWRVGLGRAGGG